MRKREPEPTYQSASTGAIPQNRGAARGIPGARREGHDAHRGGGSPPPATPERREAAARGAAGPQEALTTSLASPVAVPSVALAGIGRSARRAFHTCRALASSMTTRLAFAESYCTGIVIMCI